MVYPHLQWGPGVAREGHKNWVAHRRYCFAPELPPAASSTVGVVALKEQGSVLVLADERAGGVTASMLVDPRTPDAVLDSRAGVGELPEYVNAFKDAREL